MVAVTGELPLSSCSVFWSSMQPSTDDAPDVRGFYEKNGFVSCDKGTLVAFARLTS
ncbi:MULTISPECIES: hypothetical protein [unclassified Paenibacillus]|uniref:hypothetical protein n=1 Tax=unclassified Paenibacillus TaxID=185978 RepID=UPI0024068740|nr:MULTISPECIES: hypothetical protein [unclassified Paenibacillus]MDF9841573.1 hypothetical protein [Paenibacillus sp. PastF-2]MDF9848315.1 hypothetical protein [Paenibacillus sp. PastM-2]MDF9854732.1 hypothetical protein [Paenibacillus sp. PastF-1]MDH6480002.1 hypothetical protein [Paenibacillus sp. PastH-2]MDH6507436.1 hypothetical protein [Paenibacillus sp. PastM-3]